MKVYKNKDNQFSYTIEFNPDKKQQLTEKGIIELRELIENNFGLSFNKKKQTTADMITEKSGWEHSVTDIEYYAYPQSFCSTNPFGSGGNSITDFTVEAFVSKLNEMCYLFVLNKPQFHERFKPFLRYKN